MASTTTNLGLMKPAYSDDADISDINGNMDLIDAEAGKVRANVAANYDSSETYAVGDYCLHDGSLYKCSTAISSPEAWTAGHWTQIKITGELSALNGNLTSLSDQIGTLNGKMTLNQLNFAGSSGSHSLPSNWVMISGLVGWGEGLALPFTIFKNSLWPNVENNIRLYGYSGDNILKSTLTISATSIEVTEYYVNTTNRLASADLKSVYTTA